MNIRKALVSPHHYFQCDKKVARVSNGISGVGMRMVFGIYFAIVSGNRLAVCWVGDSMMKTYTIPDVCIVSSRLVAFGDVGDRGHTSTGYGEHLPGR